MAVRCTPTAPCSTPRVALTCRSPTRRWQRCCSPRSRFCRWKVRASRSRSTTLILLVVSTVIVLTRLDVWSTTRVTGGPAWVRRCWLAAAIVAPAVIYLEPIRSNFDFGQINVVLMTLVIADCVPRRTPWPRGLLLGVAIALKLTPAVFLLYFLLRRDTRALLVTAASAVVATLAGFAFAWRDSWEYWTETVRNTDRIGTATLNTNQNIAGVLARLGLGEGAPVRAVDGRVLRGARPHDLGRAPGAARSATRAGADLRGDVRAGGVTGVVVASLGVGAAHGAGVGGACSTPARHRTRRRLGRGGGADGVDSRSR